MKKHIITKGTKLDVADGVIVIEGYNGSIYHGTFKGIDMIEDEDGELILNPDGDGFLPPETGMMWTAGDLERALREIDDENHKVIWEEPEEMA